MSMFSNLVEEDMEIFMDDFSIYESSFKHCLKILETILQRCRDKTLALNREKCHFMVIEGIVLGYKISAVGLEVDQAKVSVIETLMPPKKAKGIRSFLGHVHHPRVVKFSMLFSVCLVQSLFLAWVQARS